MNHDRGICGWAGAHACQIDEALPGFLGELQRAPVGRRQIVFAALSRIDRSEFTSSARAEKLGRWLSRAKGREIVAKNFGCDPKGFRKALARCGCAPKPRKFYAELHAAFSEHGPRSIARVLQFRKSIHASDIAKLNSLDAYARNLAVLEELETIEDAEQLQLEVNVIRAICPSAKDDALARSLATAAKQSALKDFVEGWLSRAEVFPEPPVPGTNRLIPLRSGKEICRAARSYRNCLEDRVINVISGTTYYYEWTGRNAVIVEIKNDQPLGWSISEILGPKNRRVPVATTREIENHFVRHGIIRRQSWRRNLMWFGVD